MYLFFDESGDLGFNFTKTRTSKYFVMTLLIVNDLNSVKLINSCVTKALQKINCKQNIINELKGTNAPLNIKKIFLKKILNKNWYLYAIIIDKQKFCFGKYINYPNKLYNDLAGYLFNKVTISDPRISVIINVDKCKNQKEIHNFNHQLEKIFCPKLIKSNKLFISHTYSHEMKLLQAVDLFCYGIFEKYEHENQFWYKCFCNKIFIEEKL